MRSPRLPSTVLALALVSLLTDVSSEMIYPLLPAFMSSALGASAIVIGTMEGSAEALASLLKYASGWWSDRLAKRKPLVVAGYLIASLLRPLVGVAQGVWSVVAIRMGDRVGKGLRSAPRDALIADAVDPSQRGRAFGFHRAADHAGAVLGPLVAWVLLQWGDWSMRAVFLAAAVPAAVSMVVLILCVREPRRRGAGAGGGQGGPGNGEGSAGKEMMKTEWAAQAKMSSGGPPASGPSVPALGAAAPPLANPPPLTNPPPLPRPFYRYLGIVLLFTLGNATDAYLLLRARELGVSASALPLLWAALHVVKAVASTPAGALSDRVGRRQVITMGWMVYAAVYLGFAFADGVAWVWVLVSCYGAFFGLTEGVERALVADLVPPAARGRAFGWFHLTVGLGALPAALLFGFIWETGGASRAFGTGAALSAVAALLLVARDLRDVPPTAGPAGVPPA